MSEGRGGVIEGVATKQLKVIPDERGRLMECLRSDDDLFIKFGQMYMTTTFPGSSGWHLHHAQWDNIVCVKASSSPSSTSARGHRPRGGSTSSSWASTARCSCACPRACGTGWKCVSVEEAFIVNAPTEVYVYDVPDQDELPHDTPRIRTTGASNCADAQPDRPMIAPTPSD